MTAARQDRLEFEVGMRGLLGGVGLAAYDGLNQLQYLTGRKTGPLADFSDFDRFKLKFTTIVVNLSLKRNFRTIQN